MSTTITPQAPIHIVGPPSKASEDIAVHISTLFSSGGPNTKVHLLPSQTYVLKSPITLSHDGQEISTLGYPHDDSAKAILLTRGEKEATAINGFQKNYIKIRNLFIDGQEETFGHQDGGGALIVIGGPGAQEPVLEKCVLKNPRGWSCCHVCDFAERARIVGNMVGPAGRPAPKGPWADGLSIACKDAIVAGNTIVDATDGAIVVFCSPGSIFVNNSVIAKTRDLLGGINMVDNFPFKCDFTNTRVINNKIISDGAQIKLALGIGGCTWGDGRDPAGCNKNGFVYDNVIGPGDFGYGIAVGGALDFTVHGNVIHEQARFNGNPTALIAPPTPFLYMNEQAFVSGSYQTEFVPGDIRFLIGVENKRPKDLRFSEGQLFLTSDESRSGGRVGQGGQKDGEGRIGKKVGKWERFGIDFEDCFVRLEKGGSLVMKRRSDGGVVWSSGSGSRSGPGREGGEGAYFKFEEGGKPEIWVGQELVWDPLSYLSNDPNFSSRLERPLYILISEKPDRSTVEITSGRFDKQSVLWSSSNEWKFPSLKSGTFFTVVPGQFGSIQPPPIPSRPGGGQPQQQQQNRSGSGGGFAGGFDPLLEKGGHKLANAFGKIGFHGFNNLSSGSGGGNQHSQPPPQFPQGAAGGGPPPIPSRPPQNQRATFFFLSPTTSQAILHSSPNPTEPDPSFIHWTTTNVPKPVGKEAALNLQGDGNWVLYVDGAAVWASGSNGWGGDAGEEGRLSKLRIVPAEEGRGGARIELVDGLGRVGWTTEDGKGHGIPIA